MKTAKITDSIRVLGTTFEDIYEVVDYACNRTPKRTPKDGVYVETYVKHHLWFDESDYIADNYFYRCYVFAKSEEELEAKLEKLNFPEFNEGLAPMIFWDDEYDYMKLTDDIAVKALTIKQRIKMKLSEWFKI